MYFCVADSHGQLLKDLKALVSVLNHFESTAQLAKTAAKDPQVYELFDV